jgi:hypothetical protein
LEVVSILPASVANVSSRSETVPMNIPITVKCQCGRTTDAIAGQEVRCACGREYATELSDQQVAVLQGIQVQQRIVARLGVGLVGLVALAGFLLGNRWIGVGSLVLAGLLWWGVLQHFWRRRAVGRLSSLPPATVSPK